MDAGGFAGSQGVTFAQLLEHRSGLKQAFDAMDDWGKEQWGNDWEGLAFVVVNGTMPGAPPAYKNANHALFRILIPGLLYQKGYVATPPSKETVGPTYLEFLYKWVLEPVGLSRVDCTPGPREEALAYDFLHEEVPGRSFAPAPDGCGGHGGLRMSALDLARLMAYALHTEVLFSQKTREEMFMRLWGWFPQGDEGPYPGDEATARVWHPGDLYGSAGQEQHTCVLRYPRQVEAVLLINSDIYSGVVQTKRGRVRIYV